MAIDSIGLAAVCDSVLRVGEQQVSADYFYGALSVVPSVVVSQDVAQVVDNVRSMPFGLSLLLVIFSAIYFVFVGSFLPQIRISSKSILSLLDSLMIFNNPPVIFLRFVAYSRFLYLLLLVFFAVGFVLGEGGAGSAILRDNFYVFFALLLLLFWGGLLLGRGLFSFVAMFDYNSRRWRDLRRLVTLDRSLGSVLLAPLLVVWLISGGVAFLFCAGLVYFYHSYRILLLFRVNGFSFLQSISYLCAVELGPFALLCGVLVRCKLL